MKICKKCGKEFDRENKRALYCSHKCYSVAKAMRNFVRWKHLHNGKCVRCDKAFVPTNKLQKFCTSECSALARTRFLSIPDCLEDASRKLDKTIGYVRVYCPMHPKANGWGYVYEHRLIVEGIVGRLLTKDEHVHHINGKRWDNRPENLVLMSAADHGRIGIKSRMEQTEDGND